MLEDYTALHQIYLFIYFLRAIFNFWCNQNKDVKERYVGLLSMGMWPDITKITLFYEAVGLLMTSHMWSIRIPNLAFKILCKNIFSAYEIDMVEDAFLIEWLPDTLH